MSGMDVSYGDLGKTLTIWFDHPSKARRTETRGPDLILKKDEKGRLVGLEKANYFADEDGGIVRLPSEGAGP